MSPGQSMWRCWLAGAVLLMWLGGVACHGAAPGGEEEGAKVDRAGLEAAWWRYTASGAEDEQARATLVAGGEAAVELAIILLYGEAGQELPEQEVAELVRQLGASGFADREAAMGKLVAAMPGVASQLERHREHADAEVRDRVRRILAEGGAGGGAVGQPGTRQWRLLYAATELFERHMSLAVLQSVARRELGRLAQVRRIESHWDYRPVAPLLASLRMSADAADRTLLVRFVERTGEAGVMLGLDVMGDGLADRSREGMAEHWQGLPDHDYSEQAERLLDASRPRVAGRAIDLLPKSARTAVLLRELQSETTDVVLEARIAIKLAQIAAAAANRTD